MTEGPAVLPLGNGQVLIRGQAVIDVSRCVSMTIELSRRRDGMSAPSRLVVLEKVLAAEARAAMSARPQSDVREAEGGARWEQVAVMTSSAAAAVLGVTDRQVRRMAPSIGGRRVAGRWVFDPADVAALATERRAAA